MWLKKLRVTGFQSFRDSGDIEFSKGINLIVGQNNSGKSSLLRGMQPGLIDDRHRSPDRWITHELPVPEVFLQIVAPGNELKSGVLRRSGVNIPISSKLASDEDFLSSFWDHLGVTFDIQHSSVQGFTASNYPSHGLFAWQAGDPALGVQLTVQNAVISIVNRYSGPEDGMANMISEIWTQDMFYFKAERYGLGKTSPGHATRLDSNAANLPVILNTLQGSQGTVFQKLVNHLRMIFPTVGNLSVWTAPSGLLEILIWPTETMTRRELAFPLEESGTGVSQVIAILAAILTKDQAVFIIDEINSFLHPAAVKTLLRILQTEYAHNQYIISTHAPEVIGFSNPETIHLVKREGYDSQVTRLDIGKVADFRKIADNLGLSMADVFAADQVIWVEGPTEELCFPYIYEQRFEPLPRGVMFSSVVATGDFNRKRDRELVYQVYEKVSAVAPSMQVRVVFSFDSEGLTDTEQEKMIRDSKGKLLILPRRHIECYLLDGTAIAELIIKQDRSLLDIVTPDTVQQKIIDLAEDKKFHIDEWGGDLRYEAWLSKVDAAKLIATVCQSLSEHRATFNKKEDSLFLLQSIMKREPERLDPLAIYVQSLVNTVVGVGASR